MPDFKLPDLGEGVTEAEVERWLVEEGQTIAEDAPLVEVITDKATAEIPSPFAGLVNKIHVAEGEIVPVGTVLVTIGEDGASSGEPATADETAADDTAASADTPATTDTAAPADETTPSADAMPVTESEPVGDTAATTSAVAEVPPTELDEVPATSPEEIETGAEDGGTGIKATPTIRKLARELGVEITAVHGTGPGGRITREDVEQAASIADRFRALRASPPARAATPPETQAPAPAAYVPSPAEPDTAPPPTTPPAPAPYARPVEAYPPPQPYAPPAEPQGSPAPVDPMPPSVDIPAPVEAPPPSEVPPPLGTQPPVEIAPLPTETQPGAAAQPPLDVPRPADFPQPGDVPPPVEITEEPPSQPEAPASPAISGPVDPSDRRVPLRGIRRTIAERLAHSHQVIPPVTHVEECDLTALEETRRAANDKGASPRLSFLPFIVKAVAATLPAYPALNASLDDDAGEIVYHGRYDIGVAVDTPNGLVVPVVRAADEKGLTDVAQEIETLAAGARDGTLMMEQLRGSTFTITSPGAFGGLMATPIVLHPQTGILGVHRASERPVVREGQVVIRLMVNLSITFDHRVLDGVMAAKFLLDVIKLLEDPGVASLGGSGI